jgi:hypothetical protein
VTEFELGVPVTTTTSANEAETIAAMLRSCDIDARAEQGNLRRTRSSFSVFVHRDDLEAARTLLNAPATDEGSPPSA